MRLPYSRCIPALLALSLVPACTDRPTADDGLGESGDMTEQGTTMEPEDNPSTGGVSATSAGWDDDETGALDESSEGTTGEPLPDECEPYLDEHQSDEQRCGLTHVAFEWRSHELDLAAQCQLMAAAACIVDQAPTLYLEAHTSAAEGDDAPPLQEQEFMIELAEDRGIAVRDFLIEWGVSSEQLQVIVKGGLEASDEDVPEERRVEMLWNR